MAGKLTRAVVIGAGLAGLAAAVTLASEDVDVEILEATMQAGGRCRSYLDPVLGRVIDNGNHLVLSGNHATMAYLDQIGSRARLAGPPAASFPFVDVADGHRWTIRPSPGPIPWWLFDASRRVPGTRPADYLPLAGLVMNRRDSRIEASMSCTGPLWDRLLAPFFLAALNTPPREASTALAAQLVRESLAKGGRACAPRIASPNLSAAFIEPALEFLSARGAELRLGDRVRALSFGDNTVTAIEHAIVEPVAGATVILAVPPWSATELLPDLLAPNRFSAIVNGHFAARPPTGAAPIMGVLGGTAEWVFAFDDRIAVTVSGADHLVDDTRESLAERFWRDIAAAHGLDGPMPPWQIVKERRATFAATPEQNARRPGAKTAFANLVLAGDWTATGLPATIEGAIRSGVKAARLALAG